MEVVSFLVEGKNSYIWIPTDILNILTGVYVFVVCKSNKVWKLFRIKIPRLKKLEDLMRKRRATDGDTTETNQTTTMSSVITLVHTSIVALNNEESNRKKEVH